MTSINIEQVTDIHHWSDKTFSFKTTRKFLNEFNNGEFAMIGIEHEGKKLMRAYSFVSANYEDHLEFLSIKVKDGLLTPKLQKIKVGDEILVRDKSTGTLIIEDLLPGRNLYLISTGTGLAPFMSIIKDPKTYERFDKVILTHTVQYPEELAYRSDLESFNVKWDKVTHGRFVYFNTLTKAQWPREGRITNWIKNEELHSKIGCESIDAKLDRFMVCGSTGLNTDLIEYFESIGMQQGNSKTSREFVIEKAFVRR